MQLLWILATFGVLTGAANLNRSNYDDKDQKVRYDNFQVYSLKQNNLTQISIFKLTEILSDKFNIWKDYDEYNKEMHIMVSPAELVSFKELLRTYNIESELLIQNVQNLIDAENVIPTADAGSFGWRRYYQLHEIEAWLDEVIAANPTVTEGFIVGKSYEGRTIRGIKISYKNGNPGIFIESNIHAREWITSASATWFINQLLTSEDPKVRDLAENYDWYIIPVFNVDGFVYSHNTDRMWRKTRQPVSTSKCIGADANRNFDSHWLENGGASSNPCSETFAGSAPWSEPEAKALQEYVRGIKDKINIYLSFHSYGQYLLSPYGHTTEAFPENYDDLLEIGAAFKNAIESLPYGTVYTHGSTATALYVASGSSVDYVFNELDIDISYTIEFRDKGRYGFVLPPVQILPNCEELMIGMIALINQAKALAYV